MPTSSPDGDRPVDLFIDYMLAWYPESNPTPDLEEIRVSNGVPCIVFHVDSSGDEIAHPQTVMHRSAIVGGCLSSLDNVDYEVDRVKLLGDLSDHEGGVLWRLETDWVREYNADRITHDELLEFVDESLESVDDLEQV